jgi:serine/threonine-protein kinase RsbT
MTPVPVALDADSGGAVVPLELLEAAWVHGDPEPSALADGGVVPIGSAADVVTAREQGRALAASLGFSACDQMMIATAISELARNILEFATLGRIAITSARTGTRLGLVIEARDQGPGIADPARVVEGGHSCGFGLPGVRRLMDELEIASEPGKGTTVLARKWQFDGGLGSVHGANIPMELLGDSLCTTAP